MVALFTSEPDPLADFRRMGIDARLAWHADHDTAALVFVPAEALDRLEQWLGGRPRVAVAELAA